MVLRLAGLILIVVVVVAAVWVNRRQRRLYPSDRERILESQSSGFTGVGVVEKFRNEP